MMVYPVLRYGGSRFRNVRFFILKNYYLFLIQFNKFIRKEILTENIKIFLQLYMIKADLLTCHQDLVRVGCY